MEPTRSKSFTGQARGRTKASVRWSDRLARLVIAGGGIGTIVVVLLVCFFLFWEVVPLFNSARIDRAASLPAAAISAGEGVAEKGPAVQLGMDEHRLLGWALFPDGRLQLFRLSDGGQIGAPRRLQSSDDPKQKNPPRLTAWSFDVDGQQCALGFSDGSVRLGKIGFKTTFVELEKAPAALRDLPVGESAEFDGGMAVRTPQRQFRVEKLSLDMQPATPPVSASPIVRIAFAIRAEGPIFCTRSADGSVNVNSLEKQVNMMTDEETVTIHKEPLAALAAEKESPDYLLISGLGDSLIVAWNDGRLIRFDIRDLKKPREMERENLLAGEPEVKAEAEPGIRSGNEADKERAANGGPSGAKLTALQYMLGGATLVAGDSTGRVRTWSPAKTQSARTADHTLLVASHEFAPGPSGAAVASLAASSRSRAIAAGSADGRIRVLYVTSDRLLAETKMDGASPVAALAFAPRGDGLLAAGSQGVGVWNLDLGFPEITVASLFRPVWYEGFPAPTYSWQTSSGSDAFESKYSLIPLIFGTLKATLYSMLFGAPLALLAAIYTSEFLRPEVRARIKPAVEMMASLPSVVLGFLAGLVIAPIAETVVPAILAAFFTVPFTLLAAAYLWQLLPVNLAVRMARWRFLATFLVVPVGVAAALVLGPALERLLFSGDIKAWLNGRAGTGTPGWFVILLPLAALATAAMLSRIVNPWIRRVSGNWSRLHSGLIELAKFLIATLVCLLLAGCVALLLNSSLLDPLLSIISPRFSGMLHDPRGWVVDTYIQRNALVVGFMMGFAIIPLIYTIADDALSSVPAHLRSASLGAGATHWQTAVRIVIPTAMSGLFSAVMIGLGRAVGETMIMLMATGNTPIMEMNVFNGFQTLAAAIATQLPEAPVGGTLFRMLFLAGLTLFFFTFLVNTVAEMVRLRFRRRAHEL